MRTKTLITLILALAICVPLIALGISATSDEYRPALIYAEFEDDKIAETVFFV